MKFAGFWRRLIASALDLLIVLAPLLFFDWIGSFFEVLGSAQVTMNRAASVIYLVGFALSMLWPFFYFTFFEGKFGATAGKWIMRIKVVRRDEPNRDGIGYTRAFFRLILTGVLIGALNIDFLWLLINIEGRTIHDLAFGTIEVHDPQGRFDAFDPDKLPRRTKYYAWFFILIILSALSWFMRIAAPIS